jgi:uncharacterized membrane protein YqjE
VIPFLTLGFMGLVAFLFWNVVPLARLFDAFQPMVVTLSVIVAAVFVRLNRGMPSLEWKSLDRTKRAELTAKIVELSREYVGIVAINAFALISLVTLVVIGKDDAVANWSPTVLKAVSATVGAVFALCLARMAYVVWRDCDIMELQKFLIDNAAAHEADALETKSAESKLADIKAAGLRKQPPPKSSEL